MKTNSLDHDFPLLDLTSDDSPWRSWLLRGWVTIGLLVTSFCVFKGLEASTPKPTTQQITITEEVPVSKRMDEVREDDVVLARDEFGTEIGPCRVVQVHRRMSHHLRLLTFEARDGTHQTIETTDEHPFGSADRLDFIPAGQLPLGHQVPGPKGERQTLVASIREEHPEGIPVFNFEVEGSHTYFVAGATHGCSLLVHNQCEKPLVYRVWGGDSRPFGRSWTPIDPRAIPNYRDLAGLPIENSGMKLIIGRLKDPDSVVGVRHALDLTDATGFYRPGGLEEWLINNAAEHVEVVEVIDLIRGF